MDEQKRLETIQELERQIAGLPIGYISKKNINGKTRYYHQWTENGKKRSKYLRDGEMEPLQEQIEQRKSLQAELKKLQAGMPKQRQPKLQCGTRPGLPDLRPAPDRKNHHASPSHRTDDQGRSGAVRLSQSPQDRYHGYGEPGYEKTV